MVFNIILFHNFETLDVFGPVEVFGKVGNCKINYYSLTGGLIGNTDGLFIKTNRISEAEAGKDNILFIPGGLGTRTEINNTGLIESIRELAENSMYVITVCTGSALLARTGLLDGKKATSNKRSFDWVRSCSNRVDWIRKARWVVDGKFYTSSGISAGIDMALGFVSDIFGEETARQIAHRIEYNRQTDKDKDDFAVKTYT